MQVLESTGRGLLKGVVDEDSEVMDLGMKG